MNQMSRRDFVASALSLATVSMSGASLAADFPSRPIQLVVPYSAG
jgi:tripartite-type tricarboxylate transporter receptor subunit TctC